MTKRPTKLASGPTGELNPPPRLIMGPGPLNADPRVLRSMSLPLLGQFDPAFLSIMADTQAIYREIFETRNAQTFLIDGTARAGIEACLVSMIEHMRDFAHGVVDTRHLVFYTSLIFFFLFLTVKVVESRRWK